MESIEAPNAYLKCTIMPVTYTWTTRDRGRFQPSLSTVNKTICGLGWKVFGSFVDKYRQVGVIRESYKGRKVWNPVGTKSG